jgi:HD-GYP domain-containing protein (c-di-GMP phosphodiesterase class II)
VAVCDAFDAIISDRPYATARTPQQAVAELQRGAGTQFDPVVDAFLEVLADRSALPVAGPVAVGLATPPSRGARRPERGVARPP